MNAWLNQAVQFVKEAYAELKKVSWLSRKEAIASTVVVIILVVIVAIFVGVTDFVLARLIGIVL
jgi:preprotein translocase subunit SecE